MKKLLRGLLCTAALALSLTTAALAAGDQLLISPNPNALPERQGDFYVLVNGEFVTFTDAVPKIKNDRSCLPFVAVFEQLGFAEENMTWDGETKTVTATKGDVTISLTIGKQEILLTRAGETTVFPTDVAPYIEPSLSRTYLPFGLVADVLGYNVGWDGENKAVLIDDVDALLAANTETYDLMDKYLDYSRSLEDSGNTAVAGDFELGVSNSELNQEDGSVVTTTMYLGGPYDMLLAGDNSAYEFTWDMTMDMTVTQGDQDLSEFMKALMALGGLELPLNVEMTQIVDLTNNISYSTPTGDYMMGGDPAPGGTWEQSPLDTEDATSPYSVLSSIMEFDTDAEAFAAVVRGLLQNFELTSYTYTCKDYLAELNQIYADSAFTRDGQLYTSKLEGSKGLPAHYTALTLYTNARGKVIGYDVYTATDVDGIQTGILTCMMNKELSATIEVYDYSSDTALASVTLAMTGTYQSTTKAPRTQPPADAVIIPTETTSLDTLLDTGDTPAAS